MVVGWPGGSCRDRVGIVWGGALVEALSRREDDLLAVLLARLDEARPRLGLGVGLGVGLGFATWTRLALALSHALSASRR